MGFPIMVLIHPPEDRGSEHCTEWQGEGRATNVTGKKNVTGKVTRAGKHNDAVHPAQSTARLRLQISQQPEGQT